MCVCVRVSVGADALLVDYRKTVRDKSAIYHHLAGHKKPFKDVFDDVVAHGLDLLFEGQGLELRLIG